jgi:aspartate racemase
MSNQQSNYTLGVYGGVGPLASAKFVESIYKMQSEIADVEQEYSRIVLYSNPSIPDRTEYFLKGLTHDLLTQLVYGLSKLIDIGADEIVICCYTFHYILHDLPPKLLEKIIPLPCLALQQVITMRKRTLLICTKGSMALKVFESSPKWSTAKDYIIKPNATDQAHIHQIIFMLKKNTGHQAATNFIREMLQKYEAEAWIVGCTEFHLLSAELNCNSSNPMLGVIIDPLLTIAKYVSSKNSLMVV